MSRGKVSVLIKKSSLVFDSIIPSFLQYLFVFFDRLLSVFSACLEKALNSAFALLSAFFWDTFMLT